MKPIIFHFILKVKQKCSFKCLYARRADTSSNTPKRNHKHKYFHFFRLSVTLEEIRNFEPATKIVTTPWTPCTFVTFGRDPNRTKTAQKSWSDTLHTYNRKTITVTVRVTAKNGTNKVTNSVLLLFLKRP